jgi:hypothetical protein
VGASTAGVRCGTVMRGLFLLVERPARPGGRRRRVAPWVCGAFDDLFRTGATIGSLM